MKRFFIFLAVAILILIAVPACSPAEPSPTQMQSPQIDNVKSTGVVVGIIGLSILLASFFIFESVMGSTLGGCVMLIAVAIYSFGAFPF